MSGDVPPLPVYAFMAWTGTLLPFDGCVQTCFDGTVQFYDMYSSDTCLCVGGILHLEPLQLILCSYDRAAS